MFSAIQQLALEVFSTTVGPALVSEAGRVFQEHRIPMMPLKGVLLQRLVYGDRKFRPISDVDLLVPESRFLDAHALLKAAGFSNSSWELGGWEVAMRRPQGPPLRIDLHRRLSRTPRSRLTAAGMFARGTPDRALFDVPVVLPSPHDLFGHLLLHATLHWINEGTLHNPQDFEAVGATLKIDPGSCAVHLARQGLVAHALVLLPLAQDTGGAFTRELLARLRADNRSRAAAHLVRTLCARYPPRHAGRRLASLLLAPAISRALARAAWDRLRAADKA